MISSFSFFFFFEGNAGEENERKQKKCEAPIEGEERVESTETRTTVDGRRHQGGLRFCKTKKGVIMT
jgi:hypothetical protein